MGLYFFQLLYQGLHDALEAYVRYLGDRTAGSTGAATTEGNCAMEEQCARILANGFLRSHVSTSPHVSTVA